MTQAHQKQKQNNTLIAAVQAYNTAYTLVPNNATVVVGLSGGPDSVFLLHFLHTYCIQHNLTLIAAHLDHGWRPESAKDVEFCRTIAQKYSITFVTQTLQNIPTPLKANGSKEEIGRNARRTFLQSVAREHNADAIALAHHADDQQETFFIRLLRGASLTGLRGMQPKSGLYIRPLLGVTKTAILEYLHSHDLPYLIDATNASDAYLRNRIRNHVLPALTKADPRFATTFSHTHARLQETEDFLQELTNKTFNEITYVHETTIWVIMNSYAQLHPAMRQRILIHWLCVAGVPFPPSAAFLLEIERFMLKGISCTHVIKKAWCLLKKNDAVTIKKI